MGCPMLKKPKTAKTLAQGALVKKILAEWDGRGMKLNNVTNMEIKIRIHIISHKIYNLHMYKTISYEEIDLAYKVVKDNLSFDLTDL